MPSARVSYFAKNQCAQIFSVLPPEYRGVMSHDPESDAKFEEKLTWCFKNDKNLVNFDPSTQKSHKFAL